MTFCFDLNGTIDRFPESFKAIMQGLVSQGHYVVILTGAIHGSVDATIEKRQAEAAGWGLEHGKHYSDLVIALGNSIPDVAEAKASYCITHHAVMLFEDTLQYADICTRRHPAMATYLLMVTPVEPYRPEDAGKWGWRTLSQGPTAPQSNRP